MNLKPRFKGCPPICEATNLPMFESLKQMNTWLSCNGPSVPVIASFQCNACDKFHADTSAKAGTFKAFFKPDFGAMKGAAR